MTHVMLDIETLGTSPKAPILTVAAVEFVPSTGKKGGERSYKVNPLCYDKYRDSFVMDYSTLLWWQSQNEEARDNAISSGGLDIQAVMQGLSDFISGLPTPVFIWCQGTDFDLPIVVNAMKVVGVEVPWKFWNARDCRTLLYFKKVRLVDHDTLPNHNALGDCYKQIEGIRKCYN